MSKIEAWARTDGAAVTLRKLASQFHSSGSDGSFAWLAQVIGIRDTADLNSDADKFDFRVFHSPNEVRRLTEEKSRTNNRARGVAGYCWGWKSKKPLTAFDVVVPEEDFAMLWNLAEDGGRWVTAKHSVEQIGGVHT